MEEGPVREVWRYWATRYLHDLRTPTTACIGYFGIILKESERIDNPELRSKFTKLAAEGRKHADRLHTHVSFLYSIATSRTIEDIVRSVSLVGPGIEIVVTDDARMVPSPTDALFPTLSMIVDSLRRDDTEHVDPNVVAVITVDIDDRNHCRVIVGPDKQERNDQWRDVTEEACNGHWMGAAAAALRDAGIEIHVRSNGPLAEVTMRWAHAK